MFVDFLRTKIYIKHNENWLKLSDYDGELSNGKVIIKNKSSMLPKEVATDPNLTNILNTPYIKIHGDENKERIDVKNVCLTI